MEKPLTIVWQCALGVEEYIAAGKSMEYSPCASNSPDTGQRVSPQSMDHCHEIWRRVEYA